MELPHRILSFLGCVQSKPRTFFPAWHWPTTAPSRLARSTRSRSCTFGRSPSMNLPGEGQGRGAAGEGPGGLACSISAFSWGTLLFHICSAGRSAIRRCPSASGSSPAALKFRTRVGAQLLWGPAPARRWGQGPKKSGASSGRLLGRGQTVDALALQLTWSPRPLQRCL